MAVAPIPEGFHTITPYLGVRHAERCIDFLKEAFDAQEIHRSTDPEGVIGHAQLRIGDSMLMLSEACEQWPATPCAVYLYVPDVDATYRRAVQAGASSLMEPADQFYGDRGAGVRDAFGNTWWLGTHIRDVPPDELEKGIRQRYEQRKGGRA